MSLSQNDMGRAFEYGVAMSLCERLPATFSENIQSETAKHCFEHCSISEQTNIVKAAREVIAFLVAHDVRLADKGCIVYLQSDQMGQRGDVRDIIVHNKVINQDVGISAKNRHWAIKHSRLSEQIDFGFDWLGIHCSNQYLHTVTPIFRELRSRKRRGEKWRDIPDKMQRYYMPILQAFQTEMSSLFVREPNKVPKALVQYLLGRFDFYKVIKENGDVTITSFNIEGTLKWGSKLKMPSRISEISSKPESDTTLIMTFDQGWQISFRIHNASTIVEPSLKFDINIIGLPSNVSRNVIPYNI
jgi:hypothetical protein